MGQLFGTDGIRGMANQYPMDADTALQVGRAVAEYFSSNYDHRAKPHIVIGQDTRISSDMLTQAIAAGICSAGVDVSIAGVLPTPGVAYATVTSDAMAGIVISASHNPYPDNGIKVFSSNGYKLSDEVEDKIEAQIGKSSVSKTPSQNIGCLRTRNNLHDAYLSFLRQAVPELTLRAMTIVLDCANGATYEVAPTLFAGLKANVIPLFCKPDGININEQCGSQYPQQLSTAVLKHSADIGLAFDGDGDRLIAVDETGSILTGDQIMVICAKSLLKKGALKNNAIVSTVMSNLGFHQALKKMGVQSFITPVGDRYVVEKMLAEDVILGGEDSGHMIFRDVHTTGDGIMAALRLIEAMNNAGKPLSELGKIMAIFPQELINITVRDKPDINSIPEIMAVIKKVENELGEQGRVLVRYSGTQNKCRVMVEGPTKEQTHACCQEIVHVVRRMLGPDIH